jgi:hypothetical protein
MPPVFTPIPVHPVTGLTMVGGQPSVPVFLANPSRISSTLARTINDALDTPNLIPLFYTGGGGLSGGAVVYDKIPTTLDLSPQTHRQAEEVSPAAEFPLVEWALAAEEALAKVRKYGGKFYVADEVRDRNDVATVALLTQFLAWSIQTKLNVAALALADAELVAAQMTATTSNWSTYDPTTQPVSESPLADINEMQSRAPVGVSYDTLILSTIDALILQNTIANMAFIGQSLPGGGSLPSIVEMESLPAGSGYFVDRGAMGQVRYEQGLRTVTFREEETERTWVQSGIRPLFFVNQPGAGLKLTIPGSGTWQGNVNFGAGVPLMLAMIEEEEEPVMNALINPEPTEEGSEQEAEVRAELLQAQEEEGLSEVPRGTSNDVLTWVANDPERAQQALEVENQRETPRSTLVSQLEGISSRE